MPCRIQSDVYEEVRSSLFAPPKVHLSCSSSPHILVLDEPTNHLGKINRSCAIRCDVHRDF